MKRTRPIGEVGYGRPPRIRQFKPGQSGNLNGRPKGAKSEATILRELLNRKIEMRQDGKVRKVSILEAMLLRFAEDALKGNPKAAGFLLNRYAPIEAADPNPTDIDRDDEQLLELFTRKIEAQFKGGKE